MKRQKITLVLALSIAISFILSSCGIMKNTDFSSRKYTNFKKGESVVVINNTKHDKKISNEPSTTALMENNSEIKNTDKNNQVSENTTASHQTVQNNKASKIKEQNNFFTSKVVRKEKVQRASNFIMQHLTNKPNTASNDSHRKHGLLWTILVLFLILLVLDLTIGLGTVMYILFVILLILFIIWLLGLA